MFITTMMPTKVAMIALPVISCWRWLKLCITTRAVSARATGLRAAESALAESAATGGGNTGVNVWAGTSEKERRRATIEIRATRR